MVSAIDKQKDLHGDTRATMLANQAKADQAQKQRGAEMELLQEGMTSSDSSMQKGFERVAVDAQKNTEKEDRNLVAVAGRMETGMEKVQRAAESMSSEILNLLKNRPVAQVDVGRSNTPITIQIGPSRSDEPRATNTWDHHVEYPPQNEAPKSHRNKQRPRKSGHQKLVV